MYKVDITISATPSTYSALLGVLDKNQKQHTKWITATRIASANSNIIQALIDALEALNRPCMLDIYTESDHMVSAIRLGWLQEWKRNGWRRAKGREIKNLEQWKRLDQLLARHTVKIIKVER